jgi:hypothetical protein
MEVDGDARYDDLAARATTKGESAHVTVVPAS